MIRILHVIPRLFAGGEQTLIMNWYRFIDREKIQFDFVVCHPERGIFEDEVERYGGKIFHSPRYNGKNHLTYKKWWKKFFEDNPEYKIIHGHLRSTATIYLTIAKKYGVLTIAHSHSISNGKGILAFIKDFMQYPIRYIADYCFACSDVSGEYLFGKKMLTQAKYKMIPNGIDCQRFRFNPDIRKKVRKKYDIENKYVIGQVGRFHEPKNHKFTVELFSQICKRNKNTVLMLVGDGEMRSQIIAQADALNVLDRIIFTGTQINVEDYYQAMDIMVFPSLWEGFPIAAVEAQTSGLKCVCSANVPRNIDLTELCKHIPLADKLMWIDEILLVEEIDRSMYEKIIEKTGYDIRSSTAWLETFYLEHYQGAN